jgi:erythromycin esterase-like protein
MAEPIWRSPEDLVRLGFERSRVVLMNEAHNGTLRCVRTREIGRRILPAAHKCGVRHFAAEAFFPAFVEQANTTRVLPAQEAGYLAQPEMRAFLQAALDLGWTLSPYEADAVAWLRQRFPADFAGLDAPLAFQPDLDQSADVLRRLSPHLQRMDYTNWREEQQARNLVAHLRSLPADARLLVWCGNSHLGKEPVRSGLLGWPKETWVPMGAHLRRLAGLDPFALDQTITVRFSPGRAIPAEGWLRAHADALAPHGGTAGFLRAEAPRTLRLPPGVDAVLLSLDNAMS